MGNGAGDGLGLRYGTIQLRRTRPLWAAIAQTLAGQIASALGGHALPSRSSTSPSGFRRNPTFPQSNGRSRGSTGSTAVTQVRTAGTCLCSSDARRFGSLTSTSSNTSANNGVAIWRFVRAGYRRTTLVDLDDVARVTIDADLRFADWNHCRSRLADRFILETKSTGSPSATERALWSTGIRPDKISKSATGLAALHPELPANKWHRTLQRHFV